MEPLKSLVPFAKWLLRITLGLAVYSIHFSRVLNFDLSSVNWFISTLITLFAVLLLVGGFLKKSKLTVVSGLILFVLSVIMFFLAEPSLSSGILHSTPAAIGFYFMARGNKG